MATSQYGWGGSSIFNTDAGGGSPVGAFGGGGAVKSEASWFDNPDNMRQLAAILGKLGQAMGEKGSFGEKLGGMVSQMTAASAVNRGMSIAGQPIQQPGSHLKALDAGKMAEDLSVLSSAMKKVGSVAPGNIPRGYESSLMGSLFADPNAAVQDTNSNPTVPTSANVSGPADVGAALPARIPESVAMLMSPESVAQTHDYGRLMQGQRFTQDIARSTEGRAERALTMDEQKWAIELGILPEKLRHMRAQAKNLESDASYKDWERSPAGQEAKYKLASAGVTEAAKADRLKIQHQKDSINAFKDANPDLANKTIEGSPFTVGQLLDISADNSHAGTTLSSVLNSTLDYKAARERNVVLEKQLANAKKDSADNKTYLEITRNAEILRKMNTLQSPDAFDVSTEEGKIALSNARVLGQVRTPGMDDEILRLQKVQQQLYKKVGLDYNPLAFIDAGIDKPTGIITKADLERRASEKKKKMNAIGSFLEMFRGPSILNQPSGAGGTSYMDEFNRLSGRSGEPQ